MKGLQARVDKHSRNRFVMSPHPRRDCPELSPQQVSQRPWEGLVLANSKDMRILVYGAGNIGSLYAGLLGNADHDVSILARGTRLARIHDDGILLEEFASGKRITARPTAVEQLKRNDAYDLVLVTVGREHVGEVLPSLAENRGTPAVLFMGNNAAGPRAMVDALGTERVLLGFPGAAAVPCAGGIRYIIVSKRQQPTTIGELDGKFSPRLSAVAAALEDGGFHVAMCPHIDAWLKTHAAEIVPTACAIYMAGGDAQRLTRTRDALVLMIRAIREGYRVLDDNGTPIEPGSHRIFRWLPEPILIAIMKRMIADEASAIKLGHSLAARREMALLAADFAALADACSVETPAMKRLARHADPSADPIADGSHELQPRWRAL